VRAQPATGELALRAGQAEPAGFEARAPSLQGARVEPGRRESQAGDAEQVGSIEPARQEAADEPLRFHVVALEPRVEEARLRVEARVALEARALGARPQGGHLDPAHAPLLVEGHLVRDLDRGRV
jgi:hypothetical protein